MYYGLEIWSKNNNDCKDWKRLIWVRYDVEFYEVWSEC